MIFSNDKRSKLSNLDIGARTVDRLRRERLQVDDEWSEQIEHGFRWWPYQNAQTIRVVGFDNKFEDLPAWYILISTDLFHVEELNDEVLKVINLMMILSSLSGPVYNEQKGLLSLCSLARTHHEIEDWMLNIISVACVTQAFEAGWWTKELRLKSGLKPAVSSPREGKLKQEFDEIVRAVEVAIIPLGSLQSFWKAEEFELAYNSYMKEPPSVFSTYDENSVAAEFPWGEDSTSLFQLCNESHPIYGSGLFLKQSFIGTSNSTEDGIRLALELNKLELTQRSLGYGFGSYAWNNGLHWISFFPNALYQPNFISNVYHASVSRAHFHTVRFTGKEWTPDSFSPRRSAFFKLRNNF